MTVLRRLSQQEENTLIIVLVTSIVGGLLATLLIRWLWKLAFYYDKEPEVDEDQDLGLPPPAFTAQASGLSLPGSNLSPALRNSYRYRNGAVPRTPASMHSHQSRRSRRSRRSHRDHSAPETPHTMRSVQFRHSHSSMEYEDRSDGYDDDEYSEYSQDEESYGEEYGRGSGASWSDGSPQANGIGPAGGGEGYGAGAGRLEALQSRRSSEASRASSGPKLFGFSLRNLLGGGGGRAESGSFRGSFRRQASLRRQSSGVSNRGAVARRDSGGGAGAGEASGGSGGGVTRRQSTRILGFSMRGLFGSPDTPSRQQSQAPPVQQFALPGSYVMAQHGFMQAPPPAPTPMLGDRGLLSPPTPASHMPAQPPPLPVQQTSYRGAPGGFGWGSQGTMGSFGPSRDGSSYANTPHASQPTPTAFLHNPAFSSTAARNNFSASFRHTTEQQPAMLIGPDGNIKFAAPLPAPPPSAPSPSFRLEPAVDFFPRVTSDPAAPHALHRARAPPAIHVPGGPPPPPTHQSPPSARILGVSLRGLGFHA